MGTLDSYRSVPHTRVVGGWREFLKSEGWILWRRATIPNKRRRLVGVEQRGVNCVSPAEVQPMLTDFRVYVLQTLYEFADRELGDSLKSASVSVYYDHHEPVPPVLILGVAADIDGEEFGRVHRALVESIGLEALLWSEAEKADYRATIHCELVPMSV